MKKDGQRERKDRRKKKQKDTLNKHKYEQDRHCTYNVTLRRVRATIIAVENNKYYIFPVCVCNLRYPACNAHAPYCHLWPARVYNILPHYLIKGKLFEKNVFVHKVFVLILPTTSV